MVRFAIAEMIPVYITIALLIAYSTLIFYYRSGWQETPVSTLGQSLADIKISVIIPARNEEKNIRQLLASLRRQSYPCQLTEVIVVDDDSSDRTAKIVQEFPFAKLISLKAGKINSYKKKALEAGIAAATGELIVTTDADCTVPEFWLERLAGFKKEQKAAFMAAPVRIEFENNFLQIFQALDFMALQGITAAGFQKKIHNMCNGANLAYERKAFYEVNGFEGIDSIASGDDMLLMQKISRQLPERVYYFLSADAVVNTKAAKSWREFLQQRIRWASKSAYYKDVKIKGVLLLVYLFNLALVMIFLAGFFNSFYFLVFVITVILKTLVELFFLAPIARFFKQEKLLKYFPLFQPLHIFYTVLAGALGLVTDFEWKGRRVK
jgi:poly-beta-1,6-N-acetyl-D-glucosamine synthase